MAENFFPHNSLFWRYHLSGLFIYALSQGLIITFLWDDKLLNATACILWLPLFTLAVLGFRALYKYYAWYWQRSSRNIPGVLLYGFVAGIIITLIMSAIVIPLFWSTFINQPDVIAQKTSIYKLIFQMIIGNSLQCQLFIYSWIFIYISITTNRQAKETELYNLRLQNSLKEAQLANLSNQLNPHFLFNALNNIRFTIHENPGKADAMLTALSEILRYSLESSKYEKVPINKELSIIDRYIAIVKIQLENRLLFNSNISEKIQAYLIPPMTLQLLIENAIKHGIDELRHGGTVTLEGFEEENHLAFIINNTKPESKNKRSDNIGIGLTNIEQRLHLLYGDKASLKTACTDSHFSVALILPKEQSL